MFEASFMTFLIFTLFLMVSISVLMVKLDNNYYIKTDLLKNKKDTKIPLEYKQKIFRESLDPYISDQKTITKIEIDRNNLLMDSLTKTMKIPADKFFKDKLRITFKNEAGSDMGGLCKEWITLTIKEIIDPKNHLFEYISDDKQKLVPTNLGNDDEKYKLLGRLIGKALIQEISVSLNLDKIVYKKILGLKCTENDYKNADIQFYNNLINLRNIKDDELAACDLTFVNLVGKELDKNGRKTKVSKSNLEIYILLILEDRYETSLEPQCALIRTELFEFLPEKIYLPFNENDFEALLCGKRIIDLKDWKSNTIYIGFNSSDKTVKWFWNAMEEFTEIERSKVLHFATGSDRIPFGGFKNISGWKDKGIFKISKLNKPLNSLPTASTCANQINLPIYDSYTILKQKLRYAINECSEGFALI